MESLLELISVLLFRYEQFVIAQIKKTASFEVANSNADSMPVFGLIYFLLYIS